MKERNKIKNSNKMKKLLKGVRIEICDDRKVIV